MLHNYTGLPPFLRVGRMSFSTTPPPPPTPPRPSKLVPVLGFVLFLVTAELYVQRGRHLKDEQKAQATFQATRNELSALKTEVAAYKAMLGPGPDGVVARLVARVEGRPDVRAQKQLSLDTLRGELEGVLVDCTGLGATVQAPRGEQRREVRTDAKVLY